LKVGQVLVSTREERALRELNETAALHTDLRALRAALAGRFRDLTACQSISLLAQSADRDVYDDTSSNGSASPQGDLRFRAQGSLVQWLEANEEGLPIPDDFGVFEYLDLDERDALSAGHVRLCLPLMGTEGLVGILLFVDERAGWHVAGADWGLLRRCAEQAALVLEGANRPRAPRRPLERRPSALRGQLTGWRLSCSSDPRGDSPMKLRVTLSAIGLVLTLASLRPLFAQPKTASVCCGGSSDCQSGEVCCEPTAADGDCGPDNPGYCARQCSRQSDG
jgi:hypothetical protein